MFDIGRDMAMPVTIHQQRKRANRVISRSQSYHQQEMMPHHQSRGKKRIQYNEASVEDGEILAAKPHIHSQIVNRITINDHEIRTLEPIGGFRRG